MCMKNINATLTFEAVDSNGNITTRNSEGDEVKIVPVENKKAKILIMFSTTIVNGSDAFFDSDRKGYFKLLLLDENSDESNGIAIDNFSIDLSKDNRYYSCKYLDFTFAQRNFVTEIDLNNYNISADSVILILARTEQQRVEGKNWIPQSATPIKFVEV